MSEPLRPSEAEVRPVVPEATAEAEQEARARAVAEQDRAVREELQRRTRRSFLTAGVAAAAGYGAWRWISHAPMVGDLQRPLRKAELFNAAVSRHVLGNGGRAPGFPEARAVRDVRLNGDIGLDTGLHLDSWRLGVTGLAHPEAYPQSVKNVNAWQYETETDTDSIAADNSSDGQGGIPQSPPSAPNAKSGGEAKGDNAGGGSKGAKGGPIEVGPTTITVNEQSSADVAPGAQPGVLLTMADIRALPHVEMTTEFKCIEGWSEVVHWGGARFSDLIARYQPMSGRTGKMARYVSLETPQGDYFVGLDMEDALHPQTLLCYEMNREPLSMEHGAPLRLVIPIKYGIKHLKQIGKISFTDTKPRDYWAELGYDWYAGH